MKYFDILNNARLKYGYISNQLNHYKKYCNKIKRDSKKENTELSIIHNLESNIAKFKMTGSINYLYKNIRILKKFDSEFFNHYERYVKAFLAFKKNNLSIDEVIELRHLFVDYYGFLSDIYYLCDNRHDFEQYKIKYQWNDILIFFETQKCLNSFLDKTFALKDHRFNTQLALKILDFEKKFEIFKKNFSENVYSVLGKFRYSKELFESISNLENFLKDNFMESEYVNNVKNDCFEMMNFLKKIVEFLNGILHEDIDDFEAPKLFSDFIININELKNKKKIKPSKIKHLLLNIVEDELKVDTKERSMPFLPVFYDLAFDYISYDNTDVSMAQLMTKFTFDE